MGSDQPAMMEGGPKSLFPILDFHAGTDIFPVDSGFVSSGVNGCDSKFDVDIFQDFLR